MATLEENIINLIKDYFGEIYARSILKVAVKRVNADLSDLSDVDEEKLNNQLKMGISINLRDPAKLQQCYLALDSLLSSSSDGKSTAPAQRTNLTVNISDEPDILIARTKGRNFCDELGFSPIVQIKVATVISELARNIVMYVGEGTIEISSIQGFQKGIEIIARDHGPGISNLVEILNGEYTSPTGMGKGLFGTKNLMDEFDITSTPGVGTEVRVRKYL
jgi:serine/threonine-protein kinase RsbT